MWKPISDSISLYNLLLKASLISQSSNDSLNFRAHPYLNWMPSLFSLFYLGFLFITGRAIIIPTLAVLVILVSTWQRPLALHTTHTFATSFTRSRNSKVEWSFTFKSTKFAAYIPLFRATEKMASVTAPKACSVSAALRVLAALVTAQSTEVWDHAWLAELVTVLRRLASVFYLICRNSLLALVTRNFLFNHLF